MFIVQCSYRKNPDEQNCMSFFDNESKSQSKTQSCFWGREIVIGHADFYWLFDSLSRSDIHCTICVHLDFCYMNVRHKNCLKRLKLII